MEQRNGRIDRHGQKAKEVLVYHFVGKGYKEREHRMDEMRVGDLEADLEFLMRAVRKVEAIRGDLGKVGPVIAELERRCRKPVVTSNQGMIWHLLRSSGIEASATGFGMLFDRTAAA